MDEIEQLARDLLARLSHDYGDYEGELDSEVDELFTRGERILPITKEIYGALGVPEHVFLDAEGRTDPHIDPDYWND